MGSRDWARRQSAPRGPGRSTFASIQRHGCAGPSPGRCPSGAARASPADPRMSTKGMIAAGARQAIGALALLATGPLHGATLPPKVDNFIDDHCASCHDGDGQKGALDLPALSFAPADPKNFTAWVKVLDRVGANEMPPKKKPRPGAGELADFTAALGDALTAAEARRTATDG